ncbi:MAG: FAD-dependent oxidoreductase, partial [Clostridia bacterium]|nr:FAD-dependent oxidoreductase [Clostridia bacterium]
MLERRRISVDLCVVGGGIAGICTAIAAAREGARVALVHERPVLGGNASSEIRMWVCGAQGENNRETGILEEIQLENLYRNPTKNYYLWDVLLYEFVKREKNIELLLNTTCNGAECESGDFADGRSVRIKEISAYQLTTQRFIDVEAKYFADCSGDSILAPLTGAEFRLGREAASEFSEDTDRQEPDSMVMGMSCLVVGRETEKKVDFVTPPIATRLSEENVKNRPMRIYETRENFWYLELGGDRDTIGDTEELRDELVPLALGAWDYVKNSGKCDADNWELEFLGFLPGKRESRRMMGEYVVTQPDLTSETVFEDTVAYGGWPIDDHFPAGYYHKGRPNTNFKTPSPYCLPYRALYSRNVENLFFAGRNISMTHTAMSSIRVMATCGLLGQAVGTAAAVAAKHGTTPHGVYKNHLSELQERLMNADCFLPHFKRRISELCRNTAVTGGDCLKNGEDRPNRIYGTSEKGIDVKNGEAIEYSFDKPERINSVHIVFDSDLDRKTVPGDR